MPSDELKQYKALYFDLKWDNMKRQYPWLAQCVNCFEVTNVGENHDLVPLFQNIVDLIE